MKKDIPNENSTRTFPSVRLGQEYFLTLSLMMLLVLFRSRNRACLSQIQLSRWWRWEESIQLADISAAEWGDVNVSFALLRGWRSWCCSWVQLKVLILLWCGEITGGRRQSWSEWWRWWCLGRRQSRLFDRRSARAVLEPLPNLKPVLCLLTAGSLSQPWNRFQCWSRTKNRFFEGMGL